MIIIYDNISMFFKNQLFLKNFYLVSSTYKFNFNIKKYLLKLCENLYMLFTQKIPCFSKIYIFHNRNVLRKKPC